MRASTGEKGSMRPLMTKRSTEASAIWKHRFVSSDAAISSVTTRVRDSSVASHCVYTPTRTPIPYRSSSPPTWQTVVVDGDGDIIVVSFP